MEANNRSDNYLLIATILCGAGKVFHCAIRKMQFATPRKSYTLYICISHYCGFVTVVKFILEGFYGTPIIPKKCFMAS